MRLFPVAHADNRLPQEVVFDYLCLAHSLSFEAFMLSSSSTQTIGRERVCGFLPLVRRVVMVMMTFGAALSWNASASASCGNYLFRNGKPVGDHAMATDLVRAHSADGHASPGDPNGIPDKPCRGPNCSSSPLPFAPVPAAPSTLIRGFEQAAVLESLAKPQSNSGAIQIPESERGARFEPSTIFRPPAA